MFDEDPEDRPSLLPSKDRPLTIPAAVLWFLLAMAGTSVLIGVTQSLRPGSETDQVNAVACQAAAYVVTLALIVRVHAPTRPVSAVLGLRGTHPAFYVIGLLLGLSLQIPAELLQRLVFHFQPTSPETLEFQAEMLKMDTTLERIAVPVAAVIAGPAVEEALFRGVIFGGIRQHSSAWMAILIASFLFAAAHLSPLVFIPMFVVGAVVTFLRSESGSLWPALIAHFTFNAVTVVGLAVGWVEVQKDPEPLPLALSIGGVAVTLVLVAAIFALSRRSALAHRAILEDST